MLIKTALASGVESANAMVPFVLQARYRRRVKRSKLDCPRLQPPSGLNYASDRTASLIPHGYSAHFTRGVFMRAFFAPEPMRFPFLSNLPPPLVALGVAVRAMFGV